MNSRKGEKIGWIGGWLGSFSWVLILAIVFLIQGKTIPAVYGIVIFLIAVLLMFAVSPWRNPGTSYWQLLLPLYLLFTAAIVWTVRGFGTAGSEWFRWWNILPMLPFLLPIFILGKRKWDDE